MFFYIRIEETFVEVNPVVHIWPEMIFEIHAINLELGMKCTNVALRAAAASVT